MRVAVTGATGFVGTHLVRTLAARSHAVVALVRDPARVAGLPCADALRFDLTAPDDVDMSRFDAVVHAAAYKPTNFEDPAEARRCLEANAIATLLLAERSAAAGVGCFVYLSAGNAYASSVRPAREDDALYPSSRATYYLVSKVCGEVYADAVGMRSPNMRVVSLRAAAIYGPGMAARSLVPTAIQRLRRGETVDVKGGGVQTADYVFVGDVASAASTALTGSARGPINIGSGLATSTLEVVREIVKILDAPPSLVRIEPAPANVPAGFPALDIGRARDVLGFRPTPLHDGLSACVQALIGAA